MGFLLLKQVMGFLGLTGRARAGQWGLTTQCPRLIHPGPVRRGRVVLIHPTHKPRVGMGANKLGLRPLNPASLHSPSLLDFSSSLLLSLFLSLSLLAFLDRISLSQSPILSLFISISTSLSF